MSRLGLAQNLGHSLNSILTDGLIDGPSYRPALALRAGQVKMSPRNSSNLADEVRLPWQHLVFRTSSL
jgi:hypothetical protein